jgi:hypothetical protein
VTEKVIPMMAKNDWARLALAFGLVACSGEDAVQSLPRSGGGTGGTGDGTGGTTSGTGGTGDGTGGTTSGTGGMTGGIGGTTGGIGGTTGGTGGTGDATGGIGGTTGGTGGTGDGTGGTGGIGGTTGGTGGTGGGTGGTGGTAGSGGTAGGTGTCCSDGNCLCHGPAPSQLTSSNGPYTTTSYSLAGVGCIYYPTNGVAPFAGVAISDGYLGSGGCGRTQTSGWGPLYASHGIVTMIIETSGSDQPSTRGTKLLRGIAGLKAENENGSSPLHGKMAGRYGTSGFSMGGGGTTYAASQDSSLLTSVAIMPWGPTSGRAMTVPTLVICGSSDGTAPCRSHGQPFYSEIPSTTPKMLVTVSSGHSGQPSAGGGASGARGLAFQKVFLEGDERWRSVLISGSPTTNIQ